MVVVVENHCVNYSALFPYKIYVSVELCCQSVLGCVCVVGVCRGSEVGAEVHCDAQQDVDD